MSHQRNENTPIGKISSTGHGSARAGRAAMRLMFEESPLMVIAADGDVYAIDPSGLRADAVTSQHPEWIVGTYTRRCGAGTIAGDLVVHARQARRAA